MKRAKWRSDARGVEKHRTLRVIPHLLFFIFASQPALGAPPTVSAIAREAARLASPSSRPLHLDPALAEAAARHAREVLADERRATRDRLDAALRIEGLADAQLLPFASIGASTEAVREELMKLAETVVRARGMTHLGVAIAEENGKTALAAIFARRLVELSPLPRKVKRKSLAVRGRVDPKYRLEALLTGPCDESFVSCTYDARTVPHAVKNGVLAVPLDLSSGPGRYAFELVITEARGPEVAALWTFDYGEIKPSAPSAASDDLGALIDDARTRRELAPMEMDPALTTAARAHAKETCETMIAAHVTEKSGDPSARAAAAGFKGRVLENVAIASSVSRAHVNLMKSPSHRRNILDPLAVKGGLAVVKKDGAFCVVELFGY